MTKPKRKRRGLRLFILTTLLLGAGAAALYSLLIDVATRDHNIIAARRAHNRAAFRVGFPLPGTPRLKDLQHRLDAHGVNLGAPIFVRIFKREFELELWMQRDGRFHRFATYPICTWSGQLGPKLKEGDRQAPEGFYTVSKKQLNPKSRWHRAFNLGYPNLFDRTKNRTGSFLMVHGGCSSIGCYAMTDPVISELWRIVTAALDAGQQRFHTHIFPFRMSEEALQAQHANPQFAFWKDLKAGHDRFETEWLPPRVSVCNQRYVFSDPQTRNGSDQLKHQCPAKTALR